MFFALSAVLLLFLNKGMELQRVNKAYLAYFRVKLGDQHQELGSSPGLQDMC